MFYGAWFVVLLSQWFLSKAWCAVGLPNDCQTNGDFSSAGVTNGVVVLFVYSVVVGWLVNISKRSRFYGIFSRRRWWFFVVFYAASPVWSALSNVPGFNFSFSNGGLESISTTALALLGVVFVLGGLALVWHIVYAWRHFTRAEFSTYVVSRVLLLAYFILLSVSLSAVPNGICNV